MSSFLEASPNVLNIRLSLTKGLMFSLLIIATLIYNVHVFNSQSEWGYGDISVYKLQFDMLINYNSYSVPGDVGFYSIMLTFAKFFSFESLLVFCYFIFFLSLIAPIYQLSNSSVLAMSIFIIVFFFPMYHSLSTLVIRQGMAISVLFFLSFYFYSDQKLLSILKVLCAALFHASALFYIPVLITTWFIVRLKWLLIGWGIAVFLYVLNIPMSFVSLLPAEYSESIRSLSAITDEFIVGFKVLFLLLSISPVICLIYLPYTRSIKSSEYRMNMWKIYLVANGSALMFSGFPYYDRIMMFSWVMVPLLLADIAGFMLAELKSPVFGSKPQERKNTVS
jgi:hypothetical protein